MGVPAEPSLGADLNRFPGPVQPRSAGQVQAANGFDGHGVEDGGGGDIDPLDDLGAEAAGEPPVPAEGVLPAIRALLVRGGAERQAGLAEQPVGGDVAVPGRVGARQAGPHLPVYGDRAAGAEAGSSSAARLVPGCTPTTTSTRSACRVTAVPSAATASPGNLSGAKIWPDPVTRGDVWP